MLGCFGLRDELPEDVARFMFEDVRDPAGAIDALVKRAEGGVGPALPQLCLAVLLAAMDFQCQRGLGIARAGDGNSPDRDLAGPGFGELCVAPCEHAVEVVDLLFVGRR